MMRPLVLISSTYGRPLSSSVTSGDSNANARSRFWRLLLGVRVLLDDDDDDDDFARNASRARACSARLRADELLRTSSGDVRFGRASMTTFAKVASICGHTCRLQNCSLSGHVRAACFRFSVSASRAAALSAGVVAAAVPGRASGPEIRTRSAMPGANLPLKEPFCGGPALLPARPGNRSPAKKTGLAVERGKSYGKGAVKARSVTLHAGSRSILMWRH
mmetsp:Transcript_648/g.2568  ORF Transcript_648/g.2568 Transcript_648/m.2568 type:complete len:219 (-) Transcript_648:1069-1725(-)